MMNNQQTKFDLTNIAISLLVGIFINPILLALAIWADPPMSSNEWLHGKASFERAPFAYILCWIDVLFPQNRLDAGWIIISNMILYFVLSYVVLYCLGKLNRLRKDRIQSR